MFLIKSLTTPLAWVLLSLVLGLILVRTSRRKSKRRARVGWYLLCFGTFLLLLFSFPPFANILTYSVECRVPVPSADDLSTLDVIVVLGGGGSPSGGFRQEAELSRQAYPRLYHGVRLFREGHAKYLAFCGGEIREGKEREAEIMKAMAVHLGISEAKIVTEAMSTNTMQNAAGLAKLLPMQPPRRIGVVTSAAHMYRSARVFRSQFPDDTIVPIPVNHRYDPDPWRIKGLRPSVDSLGKSTAAVHEWIGLLWYAIRY